MDNGEQVVFWVPLKRVSVQSHRVQLQSHFEQRECVQFYTKASEKDCLTAGLCEARNVKHFEGKSVCVGTVAFSVLCSIYLAPL